MRYYLVSSLTTVAVSGKYGVNAAIVECVSDFDPIFFLGKCQDTYGAKSATAITSVIEITEEQAEKFKAIETV